MRICFVTASASRIGYGGVFPIMVGTTHALRERGHEVVVAAGRDAHTRQDAAAWQGIPVRAFTPLPIPRLHYAPGLSRWLAGQHPPFDLMSLQGVWIAMLADGLRHAKRARIPALLTPQGMLDPWALSRSRWKKSVARVLYADRLLRGVDCLHVNSANEADAVRAYGLRQPIAVIPNGIVLPDLPQRPENGASPRKLLFFGRLHTKKGVRELVSAWNEVGARASDWILQIVGPNELGLLEQLKSSARVKNIEFHGPVYGADKERLLLSADAFVLPSYSEGFPMAVLEAWAYELPVVMTRACNIELGFTRGAAFEVEPSVESLVCVLAQLTSLPGSELRAIGRRGRELLGSEYSWSRVAAELEQVYGWLRQGGATPGCVSLA